MTIAQDVSRLAANRPMIETRKSWLSLLKFMRFLRRGPSVASPRKTRLSCPALIVKARCGVLRSPLARIPGTSAPLLGTAARAAVRNRRHRGGLRIRDIRCVLRIDESAGRRVERKAGHRAVDAIPKIIGGIEEMVGGWIDADSYRVCACGVDSQTGECAVADRVGGHVRVPGVCHIQERKGRIGNHGGGLIAGTEGAAGEWRQRTGSDRVSHQIATGLVSYVKKAVGGVAGNGRGVNAGQEGYAAIERCKRAARAGGKAEYIAHVGAGRRVIAGDKNICAGTQGFDGGGCDDVCRCSGLAGGKVGGRR